MAVTISYKLLILFTKSPNNYPVTKALFKNKFKKYFYEFGLKKSIFYLPAKHIAAALN
jgi:hypothetical protein